MIAKDFIFKLPEKVRKEAVEGMETTFHFELSGDDGGDFTLSLGTSDPDRITSPASSETP